MSSHDDEEEDWQEDSEEEDYQDDSEEELPQRSLLWLCQEGQIPQAHRRFEQLLANNNQAQLEREVFQTSRDKTTALTEIVMGGTSDRNAYALTLKLLEFAAQTSPTRLRHILSLQPHAANSRTALHWACWGNASMEILQKLKFQHRKQ